MQLTWEAYTPRKKVPVSGGNGVHVLQMQIKRLIRLYLILPQLTTGKTPPRKKCQRGRRLSRAPCGAPRLNVALARLVDLKAVLLAETRARGPDGSRMRSPQLVRCSRDQVRRRMGQHGAALARGRGGGCEVFRAPPSLGRQLEARQRAGRRAASESTVVDALLATDSYPVDPTTTTGCGCVA